MNPVRFYLTHIEKTSILAQYVGLIKKSNEARQKKFFNQKNKKVLVFFILFFYIRLMPVELGKEKFNKNGLKHP